MINHGTPVEDHRREFGLMVKREDMSCSSPAFSKTRGVWAHLNKVESGLVGVLDTYHSQAGHAVARACELLGKQVINFYPEFKYEPGHRKPQDEARGYGAELRGIPAGRSAILFHQAKRILADEARARGVKAYMMPNALKLPEMVVETEAETKLTLESWPAELPAPRQVIIPSSSATIAAGVIAGFIKHRSTGCRFFIHLGYERTPEAVTRYVAKHLGHGLPAGLLKIINQGYGYKDKARGGPTPPWPCNEYYDLKAFRWWMSQAQTDTPTLFWNIG